MPVTCCVAEVIVPLPVTAVPPPLLAMVYLNVAPTRALAKVKPVDVAFAALITLSFAVTVQVRSVTGVAAIPTSAAATKRLRGRQRHAQGDQAWFQS